MSMKDAEMHMFSLFGAAAVTAVLFGGIVWFTDKAEAEGPILAERQVIEAKLAYKKTTQKQPQKVRDQQETVKPVGVSHDENKKVEEKKDEKKKDQKVDPKDPFKGFHRPDEEAGSATTKPDGAFDGSTKGFAPINSGDKFWAELLADMNFQFPEIAKAQSIPIGCIHLQPDGRIKAFTFDPPIGKKGDDDLQTAAEAAMREVQKKRNANPIEVPTHLLQYTTNWQCFKFSVQ